MDTSLERVSYEYCKHCNISRWVESVEYSPTDYDEAITLFTQVFEMDEWGARNLPETEVMSLKYAFIPKGQCPCGNIKHYLCWKFKCNQCGLKNIINSEESPLSAEEKLSAVAKMLDLEYSEAWKLTELELDEYEFTLKPTKVTCSECDKEYISPI